MRRLAKLLRKIAWQIDVKEGQTQMNFVRHLKRDWGVFTYYTWPKIIRQLKIRIGLLEPLHSFDVIKNPAFRMGMSYRLEDAKEQAELREQKRMQARQKGAEKISLIHAKRSWGHNKDFFHADDPINEKIENVIKTTRGRS